MRLPRRVEAVVFDMDGLLVDTETMYRDAMLAEAEALGRPMPVATYYSMIGTPQADTDRIAGEHFGGQGLVGPFNAGVAVRVNAALASGVCLKVGAVELLDHLEVVGLPRAIATSSSHTGVLAHLGPSGILPRFQAVVANGDYARGKPFPDPYLTAAAALGVAPEACLALEDSHNGVRAAHAAGMMTVMVPDLLEATDEMRSLCVAIRASLHEVLEGLKA